MFSAFSLLSETDPHKSCYFPSLKLRIRDLELPKKSKEKDSQESRAQRLKKDPAAPDIQSL